MGLCRRDRSHRESQLGRIKSGHSPLQAELHGLAATESATGRLAAVREALPEPAPRCGENSRPGKVHHRLEDSREAILWFQDTRLSSGLARVFGTSVANKPNRATK